MDEEFYWPTLHSIHHKTKSKVRATVCKSPEMYSRVPKPLHSLTSVRNDVQEWWMHNLEYIGKIQNMTKPKKLMLIASQRNHSQTKILKYH